MTPYNKAPRGSMCSAKLSDLGICVTKWTDKNCVAMASTVHGMNPISTQFDFLELREKGSKFLGRMLLNVTTNIWVEKVEWIKTSATIRLLFERINGGGPFSHGSSLFRFKMLGFFNEKRASDQLKCQNFVYGLRTTCPYRLGWKIDFPGERVNFFGKFEESVHEITKSTSVEIFIKKFKKKCPRPEWVKNPFALRHF